MATTRKTEQTTANTTDTDGTLPGNVPTEPQAHNLIGAEVHGDSGTGQLDRDTATDNALRNSQTATRQDTTGE